MNGFIVDMKRSARYRPSAIELAFTQISYSALVFGSCRGVVKKEHTNLLRRWMKKRPNVEYGWNALIQRLGDHGAVIWRQYYILCEPYQVSRHIRVWL